MGLDDQPSHVDVSEQPPLPIPGVKQRFKITRHGLMTNDPGWTMPKDTESGFLKFYERRGKATPGPQETHVELSWKGKLGQFGKGQDRQTFCDDAIEHS